MACATAPGRRRVAGTVGHPLATRATQQYGGSGDSVTGMPFLIAALVSVVSGNAAEPPDRGIEPMVQAPDQRKVALVVGNGAYQHVPRLSQAPRDAQLMGRTLTSLGFEVIELLDADRVQMSRGVATFGEKLRGAGAGLFYYAGHAIQVGGVNYMIPVDAQLRDPAYVDSAAIDARRVQQALEGSRAPVAVLVLDACRDNPFANQWSSGSRSVSHPGLAQMATRGLLIAYATNPGNTAQDSGLYATSLARNLAKPCQSVMDGFYQVRDEVLLATKGTQVPWIGGSPGMSFSRYQPAGCNGNAPSIPAGPAVLAPVAAGGALAKLQARLQSAKALYQRRCVDELGSFSTADERRDCHARYHAKVQEAQDALDAYVLEHPTAVP